MVLSFAYLAMPVWANETVTYSYDALGRLVGSSTTGTVNSGLGNAIVYDAPGNRASYAVTGSANSSLPPSAVIVVPLAGFTVIPIYKTAN